MFRPVGSQPPSVYWRRRLVFIASVIVLLVLIALTIRVLTSSDTGGTAAAGSTSSTSSHAVSPTTKKASTSQSSTAASSSPKSSAKTSHSTSASTKAGTSASSSAMPKPCTAAALHLTTDTDKSSYSLTANPTMSLLVTNTSKAACVQNLGDTQIVMRVYNGESRVWGSHDCKIDKTPNERTLEAGATVRLNIGWTEYASMPNQCSNRQHVGAGTYTLYASLSGKEASASQFSITP